MSITVPGPFIIGFNGPPRVGKDTIASCLIEKLDSICDMPVHRHALAGTMRDGAMAILGLNGGDRFYSNIKDQPLDVLNGVTFRRFMIDMSEVFVKQCYGQDFWARLLHSRNKATWNLVPSVLVITDIGFSAEVEYLCEHSFGYINVRLDRPDCDFTADSRGYVAAQNYGGHDIAITNDEKPEDAVEPILKMMTRLGWPVL